MTSVFRLIFLSLIIISPTTLRAEFKASPLEKSAPDGYSQEIRNSVQKTGWQIAGDDGKPLMNFWLRSEVTGQVKPSGAKGTILFPFLSEGELLGVVEVLSEIGDYRDQPIAPGFYTFRYGLQPVNGDHLGASPFRDYACLIPAGKDQAVATLTKKNLESRSAEAAGTSHPAIMMFLAPKADAKAGAIVRDDENDRTSIVIPLNIKVEGANTAVLIQWIVAGRAPV